jgi:tetratricopeptide (TPR) repeat protein
LAGPDGPAELLAHFADAFRADPVAAYRDWFRVQEELTEREDESTARVLADHLWSTLPTLSFETEEARARFFHNVAVFFGTPGPAADLSRAQEAFSAALDHFSQHQETGWRARALHNLATALSNLGQTSAELQESVAHFQEALAWRTPERAIARGVSAHNMGIVLRRLAELDPASSAKNLVASAAALREAVAIRESHNLAEGHALSLFQLGLTLEALGEAEEASRVFGAAADQFDRLGKTESASIARGHADCSR